MPVAEPAGIRESRAILDWLEKTGRVDAITLGMLRHSVEGCPADGDWDARQLLLANARFSGAMLVEAMLEIDGFDTWTCPEYRITGLLGEGGIGTVFRATRDEDGAEVAIKLLHDDVLSDPTTLPRLEREVDVARRLAHPGLPWYGLLGTSNAGTPFVEMQLLEGRTLLDAMDDARAPLSERLGWRLLGQLARVLEHLDEHGVVHRDVKPGNIILSRSVDGREDGHVYLCDLGLAWAPGQDAEVTGTGDVVGTPFFMSPEHAYGDRDLPIESDVYALAATVFYAVTASMPYDGPNALEIMRQHANSPVPSARARNPELTRVLDKTLYRAMAKDASARPRPRELAEEADRALAGDGESSTVAPRMSPSPSQRVPPRRLSTRRPRHQEEAGGGWVRPFAILVLLIAILIVAALVATR